MTKDTQTKVIEAMSEIFTKATNASKGGFSTNYQHYFVEVITCLVDAETKSWRDAYEEALKNIGMLGEKLNNPKRKNKGSKE